jgi:hypothetical protein
MKQQKKCVFICNVSQNRLRDFVTNLLKKYRLVWELLHILKKGKAVPLQAWSGPQGLRKLRFLDFMTTAQDGGNVVSLTHRPPLPPGNTPGTHFC